MKVIPIPFADTSAGSAESRVWDFGDGSGSAEQNPEHTYTAPGKYTVRLKTANRGGESTATDVVEITTPGRKSSSSITGTAASSPMLLAGKSYPNGTVTVLHFNNAGPVEDAMGHTWFGQNLLYSSSVKKFGGGSALFNGNAWIATNDTVDFSPGTQNFTFSAWVYPTSPLNGYGTVWGNWWCCGVGGSTLDFYGGKPRIVYDNYGTKIITGTRALPLNTWSNVVLQGKNANGSSDVTLYVNGRPNGTLSGPYNIRKPMAQANMFMDRSSTQYFLLQAGTCIDDFFIVKGGPALYEGPFTPPEQEFGEPVVPPQTEFYVYAEGVGRYHGTLDDLSLGNTTPGEFYNLIHGQCGTVDNEKCWDGRGLYIDDEAGSVHWNTSELADSYSDNADFSIFVGHGWNNGIVFGTPNSVLELEREQMSFGGTKAKWVSIFACDVLNQSTWTNWESVFNGVHIINGFDTHGLLFPLQGTKYAQMLTGTGGGYDRKPIRTAWKEMLKETINKNSIKGASMWAEPCGNDYLPGFGDYFTPIKNGQGKYTFGYESFNCSYT